MHKQNGTTKRFVVAASVSGCKKLSKMESRKSSRWRLALYTLHSLAFPRGLQLDGASKQTRRRSSGRWKRFWVSETKETTSHERWFREVVFLLVAKSFADMFRFVISVWESDTIVGFLLCFLHFISNSSTHNSEMFHLGTCIHPPHVTTVRRI